MLTANRSLVVACALAVAASPCTGIQARFSGEASARLGARVDTSSAADAALRYIPALALSRAFGTGLALDLEASANAWASAGGRSLDAVETDWDVEPYRLWLRLDAAGFEARAGLQKISFGSAMLLRPLMWFDRVDPRDPLELTDGVYGLLGRYYFKNNANVWAWGLLGNSEPKGWEVYGSDRWTPEFGGRAQLPVPRGEVGITVHHRTAAVVWGELPTLPPDMDPAAESRVGLDGRWDVGVGLWFEATIGQTNSEYVPYPWQRAATIGLDYTFGVGSGLGVTAEHMLAGRADYEPFARGTDVHLSALMLSFPLGLLDNLRGMVYYDWTNEDPYSYLGWQRTLDDWAFSVGAFWNPDQPSAAGRPIAGAAGKGVRFDVVFNH